MTNVGLVTEMISPYRVSVFNELDRMLDGRLRVFFLAERAGRDWPLYTSAIEFPYRVLPGRAFQPRGPATQVVYANAPVAPYLRAERVGTVFVGGYNHLEYVWAWGYTRVGERKLVLWSESVDAAARGGRARSAVKRAAVAMADAYLVPGRSAESQLRYLGADPLTIFTAPNSVDVEFWSALGFEARPEPRAPSLVFAGSLVHRKGVDVLLDALDTPDLRELELHVVGTGPLREQLEGRAAGLRVTFHGHLEPEALRDLYARADVFVLPTRADPWGLVLNESMAAGCVPISTVAAGATADLVIPEETGLVVPPEDPGALRAAIARLTSDHELRESLRRRARDRSLANSPTACAAGFVDAVEACRAA